MRELRAVLIPRGRLSRAVYLSRADYLSRTDYLVMRISSEAGVGCHEGGFTY